MYVPSAYARIYVINIRVTNAHRLYAFHNNVFVIDRQNFYESRTRVNVSVSVCIVKAIIPWERMRGLLNIDYYFINHHTLLSLFRKYFSFRGDYCTQISYLPKSSIGPMPYHIKRMSRVYTTHILHINHVCFFFLDIAFLFHFLA